MSKRNPVCGPGSNQHEDKHARRPSGNEAALMDRTDDDVAAADPFADAAADLSETRTLAQPAPFVGEPVDSDPAAFRNRVEAISPDNLGDAGAQAHAALLNAHHDTPDGYHDRRDVFVDTRGRAHLDESCGGLDTAAPSGEVSNAQLGNGNICFDCARTDPGVRAASDHAMFLNSASEPMDRTADLLEELEQGGVPAPATVVALREAGAGLGNRSMFRQTHVAGGKALEEARPRAAAAGHDRSTLYEAALVNRLNMQSEAGEDGQLASAMADAYLSGARIDALPDAGAQRCDSLFRRKSALRDRAQEVLEDARAKAAHDAKTDQPTHPTMHRVPVHRGAGMSSELRGGNPALVDHRNFGSPVVQRVVAAHGRTKIETPILGAGASESDREAFGWQPSKRWVRNHRMDRTEERQQTPLAQSDVLQRFVNVAQRRLG